MHKCKKSCTFVSKFCVMKVLVILTGGTISMVRDAHSGSLCPADLHTFKAYVPEMFAGDNHVDMMPFDPLLDSSDLNPDSWRQMAQMVQEHYDEYASSGFFTVVREDSGVDTREEVCQKLAEHFALTVK